MDFHTAPAVKGSLYMSRPPWAAREGVMNIFTGAQPRIIGATVYALNLTHGLAPARPAGEPEIVTEVISSYSGLIKTDKGNVYSNGEFGIQSFA